MLIYQLNTAIMNDEDEHQLPIPCPDKRCHFIFDYNSRISWSIFIFFSPMETGMNITEFSVIYLISTLMMS